MKGFVLDENVPARLTFEISLPVISSSHALRRGAGDGDLWAFAREKELVIITKDADFSDRILVSTPPPWIVHLRFGNLRRRNYQGFLAQAWPRIEALLPEHKMIAVYLNRIEAIR